ncbi:biopolymer transporter ExbD [Kiloniella sp. EL199]|uniref:ExbD/TolR family protein n=1 Tax=Kiloniella sp. EL199 TaxID=2107581 RepID=UPI000EA2C34E|nr:biopolymer transporter ExbD [Kiloniella sp. EL199]
MRVPLKRSENEPVVETMLPLINIVFLMLIFFMVAGRIQPKEHAAIILPQSSIEAEMHGDLANVSISRNFQIHYLGQIFGQTEFLKVIEIEKQNILLTGNSFTIRADEKTDAGKLFALLVKLKALGIEKQDLVTIQGR